MTRWIYGWILSAVGFFVILIPACNQFSKVAEEGREFSRKAGEKIAETAKQVRESANLYTQTNASIPTRKEILQRSPTEIIIGTYNIERFGIGKLSNPKVISILAEIVRQFDVLAIQEVRSRNDQDFLQKFVNEVNRDGSSYSYVLSPILGTKGYSEQYAFIFDTNRIELLDEGAIVPDPHQLLNREPMFSRFRTRTTVPRQSFSFTLANVHIAPRETRHELSTLYEVYVWLQGYLKAQEDDVILLGDFNEPPRRYGQLWNIPTMKMVLPEEATTNTLRTSSYDNILFDTNWTHEFTGKSGVLDVEQAFGLTREQASEVSDHLPVWAAFSAGEVLPQTQFARQPSDAR